MVKLYTKDNAGAIRFWEINEDEVGLEMRYGQVDGAVQYSYEDIPFGKGGRTLEEQIESRMQKSHQWSD